MGDGIYGQPLTEKRLTAKFLPKLIVQNLMKYYPKISMKKKMKHKKYKKKFRL